VIKSGLKVTLIFIEKNLEWKPNQLNINSNKNKNRQIIGNFINNGNNYNNKGYIRNKQGEILSKDNININSNNSDYNFIKDFNLLIFII